MASVPADTTAPFPRDLCPATFPASPIAKGLLIVRLKNVLLSESGHTGSSRDLDPKILLLDSHTSHTTS
jgi:hypothetical protein